MQVKWYRSLSYVFTGEILLKYVRHKPRGLIEFSRKPYHAFPFPKYYTIHPSQFIKNLSI